MGHCAVQVLYAVAPEVYRDVMWEDIDVADPAEYTYCRYTPVTTEVSPPLQQKRVGGPCVVSSQPPVAAIRTPCKAPCSGAEGAHNAMLVQDARDFGSDGYSLRVQHKFSRHIKLLICVTLYNEDQETLGKTLLGICEVSCLLLACLDASPPTQPAGTRGLQAELASLPFSNALAAQRTAATLTGSHERW
jgi:hypothetical protein